MSDFNYFTEHEQPIQAYFKRWRDRWFGGMVAVLIKLGISPNTISALGVLCLVPFGFLLALAPPTPGVLTAAMVFLALHITLDGLDGALARRLGQAGPGGTLVDMVCDHGGMVIVSLQLALAGLANGAVAGLYIATYTLLIVFIVWLNALNRPFKLLVRTKYLLYALILLWAITGWDIFTEFMLFISVYHLIPIAVGFYRLRTELDQQAKS